MSKNYQLYSLSYLLAETQKAYKNYKNLEKTAVDIKDKMFKNNEQFTRKSYDLFFTQSEAKFREVELAHLRCDEINSVINEIRISLDTMKEAFEEMNRYANKNEVSSLKNKSGKIVNSDYDVTGNEYIQEIINNNKTIAEQEKLITDANKGGKRTKKILHKKNKTKKYK